MSPWVICECREFIDLFIGNSNDIYATVVWMLILIPALMFMFTVFELMRRK